MVTSISGINSNVNGGMPRKDIHLPPYILRIGRLRRSEMRYIPGTINKVMKKAKAKPKMIVHDNGFQNTTLSPPKKMCGFRSENSVMKLMLKPKAMGINPRIAARAVNNTG